MVNKSFNYKEIPVEACFNCPKRTYPPSGISHKLLDYSISKLLQ